MAENVTYTLTRKDNQGQSQTLVGKVEFDATAITATDYIEIDVGFKPTKVVWENATDRIQGVHYQGMADESCIKTAAAGTRTLEVTGGNKGITLTDRGFRVAQNATLGLIAASKVCYFDATA
jgi:hypothetical protein